MKPYLIVSHDYTRLSAGVRALHRLCHVLNEIGCEAFVTSGVVNPNWNTPTATPTIIENVAQHGIVVYPETDEGNPLNAKRVVRYLLNRPGLIRGSGELEPGEMHFAYCGLLREFVPDDHILTVPVVDREVFRNHPVQDRYGAAMWTGRGKLVDVAPIPQTEGTTEITFDWPKTAKELADLFRRSELFYTYQNYTALTIEARLCDCPVVVIPNELYTWDDFITGQPGGVAGMMLWNRHDMWDNILGLIRARRTIHNFMSRYAHDIRKFEEQLARFVKVTQAGL